MFRPSFVFGTLCPSSFAIILMWERELMTLLKLSSLCLVTVSILWHGDMDLSAVCYCGIS